MKVLILNSVALNGGDAAIIYAIVHIVRTHLGEDATFVVHDSHFEAAGRYYGTVAPFHPTAAGALGPKARTRWQWRRRRVTEGLMRRAVRPGAVGGVARRLLGAQARRVVDDYRAADLVVSTGGTYLREIYDLESRLFSFELALAAGKPLGLFTMTLGPFRKPRNRAAFARMLPRTAFVLLRDELSRTHLHEIGVGDANLRVAPDTVFALARPERLAARPPRPAGTPLRVAVSMRHWNHFENYEPAEGMRRYVEAVRAAVVRLVEAHGAEVTFLSTAQGIPEYGRDDSAVAREVVDGLSAPVRAAVVLDDRFHEPTEMMDMLSGFDLVVATRMHMAIMALNVGTPVLAIAPEFKTRELFQGLGLGRWVHDMGDLQGSVLADAADALVADLPAVQAASTAVISRARDEALASGAVVAAAVDRRGA